VLAAERELQLAVQLSDWHNAADDGTSQAKERLVHVHEVRVQAGLDLSTGRMVRARAAERERRETWASPAWTDRSAAAGAMGARPTPPGVGSFVLSPFRAPADRLLAPALLHLAPGFVQCPALFAEHAPRGEGSAREALPFPTGGYTDSCYMWRAGGPLVQI